MKHIFATNATSSCCHPGSSVVLRLPARASPRRSPLTRQSIAGARTSFDLHHANGTAAPQDMATFNHTVPFKSATVPPATIKPRTLTPSQDAPPSSIELPKPSSDNSPPVVYAPGKAPQAIAASLQALLQRQRTAIAVKVDPAVHKAVAELLPDVEYNATARLLVARAVEPFGLPKVPKLPGSVAVVASSALDLHQVEECRILAEHLGCYAFKLCNLDMTDMHTLMQSAEAIKAADVVIVVSSSESALPAAVASIVDAPIVAVPVSGQAGRGPATGLAPSEAFMASCTPGVTVVSPDAGYAAAATAARVLRMASRLHHKRTMAAAAAAAAHVAH